MNKGVLFQLKWFLFSLMIMISLIACGGPREEEVSGLVEVKRNSPEAAVKTEFEIWTQRQGTPYRNVRYTSLNNDGTFATIRVVAEFRETAQADWTELQTDIECRQVGGQWQCDDFFVFQLSDAEVAAIQQATSVAVEATATFLDNFYVTDISEVKEVVTNGRTTFGRVDAEGTEFGSFKYTATFHNDSDRGHCIGFGFKVRVDSNEYPSTWGDIDYDVVPVYLEPQQQKTMIIVTYSGRYPSGQNRKGKVSDWQIMAVDGEPQHRFWDATLLRKYTTACNEYQAAEIVEVD